MLHAFASLLGIIAGRSRSLDRILRYGEENFDEAPEEFQKIADSHLMIGCFLLPFTGSSLERRTAFSKFIFGFNRRYQCWFAYGEKGILLYVDESNWKFVEKDLIRKISTNLKDGSLIVIKFHSPGFEKIRLKFGGESSALKIGRYLSNMFTARKGI